MEENLPNFDIDVLNILPFFSFFFPPMVEITTRPTRKIGDLRPVF